MEFELAQSFDIDKIDGIGAVGVARLFVMSGKYATSIYYNPIGNAYGLPTPNMVFKRKYFNILDKLHLDKSKEIAEERLSFITKFFIAMECEIKAYDVNQ
jgi:uncharacterized protein